MVCCRPMAQPSPAFAFAAQAPLAKYQAGPSGTVVATLNNLAGVSNVTWTMLAVDDLTYVALGGVPSNYTLTISGPKNSVCTFTAPGAGTCGKLQATVNGGFNTVTEALDPTFSVGVKWWVPAANGNEVPFLNEELESGPQGWLPPVSNAIRNVGAVANSLVGGGAVLAIDANGLTHSVPLFLQTNGSTPAQLCSFPLATGYDAILTITLNAVITTAGALAGKAITGKVVKAFRNPSGTPTVSTGTSTPTTGALILIDETSGAFVGFPLNVTFSPSAVTLFVVGPDTTAVDWSVFVDLEIMPR